MTGKDNRIKSVESKVIEKLKCEMLFIIHHFVEIRTCLVFSCVISGKKLRLNLKPRRDSRKRFVIIKLQIKNTCNGVVYYANSGIVYFRIKCFRNN